MREREGTADIELRIISTMLQRPDSAGEAFALLSESDFGIEAYGKIFATIERLRLAAAPVDPVTVEHELGEDYHIILRQTQVFEPVNLSYYAGMLKEQGKLREIQFTAVQLSAAESYSEAEGLMSELNGLFVTKQHLRVLSAADAAQDFCNRATAAPPEYLRFGMKRLDSLLYTELGDMMIIGGYPSSGKTLLSLQMAATLAKKYRVGFFSLETSPSKLTDRLLSHLSAVPLAKIKSRDLGNADWISLTRAAEELSEMQLDFVDAGGMSTRDIQALALSRKYQVVFIDYLQLISGNGKQSRYEQVTQISQDLHTMGRAHGMAIIALAQLKRPERPLRGKPQPPTMSDFRESGQIEQDADSAIIVYPKDPDDYKSDRVLYLAKNKEGQRARYELEFHGAIQTLREKPKSYEETQAEIRRAAKAAAAAKSAPVAEQMRFTEIGDNSPLPF